VNEVFGSGLVLRFDGTETSHGDDAAKIDATLDRQDPAQSRPTRSWLVPAGSGPRAGYRPSHIGPFVFDP
jgi:hypothetical protein